MLVGMTMENNTQNHVQVNFNFKVHDSFPPHFVTDVNASANKSFTSL